jgi:hypothetical protein
MKKISLFALFFGISVMFWTPAMAKKKLGALPAPNNVNATVYPDKICLSWEAIAGAVKYSLDFDVNVDRDGDSFTDTVVQLSFGTGDRTDGGEPSDPNLCVPLTDFVFDIDGDDVLDQISGTAQVKVKALNPGKHKGRQNNAFSASVETPLTSGELPPDPLLDPQYDPLLDPLFGM